MPFPLQVAGLTLPTPEALGFAVALDLARGGGGLRPGVGPATWLSELAQAGALDLAELRALVRALLGGPPAAVALGTELCDRLRPDGVGPWLVAALRQRDLGTLLAQVGERSVEEALARAAATHADLSEPADRAAVLAGLRACGAPLAEAQTLARWGSPEERAEFGPGLRALGDPAIEAILDGRVAPAPP